ncbi:MAG: hypothetical protein CMP71_01045 [Flavobacteriales bacterium]|nr:hypothetical protein [Flavobacteriales bacterium]
MTKEIVLITGYNGSLAKQLTKFLKTNYTVRSLTSSKESLINKNIFFWDPSNKIIDTNALKGCSHIVHLAGFPILSKWTKKNKKLIYDSRIKSSRLIFNSIKKLGLKIETFISASAIGVYKDNTSINQNEGSSKSKSWIGKLVSDWEVESNKFNELNLRCIQLRIPLIFDKKHGFLKYNLLSMKFGMGLIFGNKNQILNWVSTNDICRFIEYSIKNKNIEGPFNIASSKKYSKIDILRNIRLNKYKYSIIISLPDYLVDIIFGEKSSVIKSNINICSKKINNTGFKFYESEIEKII